QDREHPAHIECKMAYIAVYAAADVLSVAGANRFDEDALFRRQRVRRLLGEQGASLGDEYATAPDALMFGGAFHRPIRAVVRYASRLDVVRERPIADDAATFGVAAHVLGEHFPQPGGVSDGGHGSAAYTACLYASE